MKRRWRFLVELLSTKEAATSLALFRIAVALVVLGSLWSVADAELVDALWVDSREGGYRRLGAGNWLMRWLGGPTRDNSWGLVYAAAAGAVLLLAGVLSRFTAFVTLHAYGAVATINGDASGGYDAMIGNALWLLVLADAGRTLSLTCWLRERRLWSLKPVSAWPRYLMILQLVVIYTATGLQKVSLTWNPLGGYSALYWVFQDPTWIRADMTWTAWVYPLTQLATALTWHWEIAAPVLLLVYYYRYTADRAGRVRAAFNRYDLRWVFAGIGVALHLGILLALNVGPFSWISLSYYLCLFHPDEYAAWFRRGLRLLQKNEPPMQRKAPIG